MSFSGWKKVKIEDVVVSKNQGVNTTTEKVKYSEEGIIVVRAKNISDYEIDLCDVVYIDNETYSRIKSPCKPQYGDLLYTNIGSNLGSAAIVKNKNLFIIAWNVLRFIVDKEKIDNRFFMYTLNWEQYKKKIMNLNSSSTMPFVSGKVIDKVELLLPPINEQKRIAHILSTLDEKIEVNNQINKTLENMAQAIFKQWFVDFEFSNEAGEPYKSSGGEMVESELGMIPEGWEVKNLGEIIEINPGYKLENGTEYPFVSMKELRINSSAIDLENVVNKAYKSGGMKFTNGDTLLARITPCLENGKTAFIDFLKTDEQSWGSTEFIVMRMKKDIRYPVSYVIARNEFFREYAIKHMTGSSGRQRVNKDVIENYKISLPKDLFLLKKYGFLIESFFNKVPKNNKENQILTTLRDTLLPKLMSGEIRVPLDSEGEAL